MHGQTNVNLPHYAINIPGVVIYNTPDKRNFTRVLERYTWGRNETAR